MAPFKRHLRDLWLEEELIQGDDEEEDVDMMTVTAQRKRLAMVQRGIGSLHRNTPLRHAPLNHRDYKPTTLTAGFGFLFNPLPILQWSMRPPSTPPAVANYWNHSSLAPVLVDKPHQPPITTPQWRAHQTPLSPLRPLGENHLVRGRGH
ncbi:hypothetical protein H257_19008 [Aphanomyces astaci]|uniref:Uncharacterized protein n=1 Tax=Aphanomyces astaci TaxID=112090 RepID=W4F9D7_APHAT|nr:hypothetical protein H257_19008 [Aphanomyces astaci]ETV64052.1 hypothetical protein H257_19008 [Aphanomyces astaci]|eukprot:XP_009846467.1 hypothetical protein H257_19008 [Aphanomyces astaci]